ncbi:MAG TPA: hypothetical protein VF221_21150 [Chloroflexota bacterium]
MDTPETTLGSSGGDAASEVDYIPLLTQLAALRPPIFIFGGIAEDALLYGSISRPHGDVDLVIRRDEVDDRIEQLRDLGFREWMALYAATPDRPLVLGSRHGPYWLELGVADQDANGHHYFVVRAAATDRPVRVSLPSDIFEFPAVRLNGISLRTISPLAAFQIRTGLALTGAFSLPGDVERHNRILATLRARFFPGESESRLLPTVGEVTGP